MRAALACASVVLSGAIVFAAQAPRQEPTLADVLQRAATYVADFQDRLSGMVAEEVYVQDWYSLSSKGRSFGRRELRSDLVLTRPAGASSWAEFRDVFEVDGRVIRSRDDGPASMLREPASSIHLSTVLAESARFNLGIERNVNTPLFPLRFLEAGNQPRFRFERNAGAAPMRAAPTTDAPAGAPADTVFRASTDVWAIAYREVQSGTLIRTAQRKDRPARGRFWIEPATGRVLASELVVDDREVRATIEVSYRAEPSLDMLVPQAMRERCEGRKAGSVVDGRATYGRFRRRP